MVKEGTDAFTYYLSQTPSASAPQNAFLVFEGETSLGTGTGMFSRLYNHYPSL